MLLKNRLNHMISINFTAVALAELVEPSHNEMLPAGKRAASECLENDDVSGYSFRISSHACFS